MPSVGEVLPCDGDQAVVPIDVADDQPRELGHSPGEWFRRH